MQKPQSAAAAEGCKPKGQVRILFDLEIRPSDDELTVIAEQWQPFRTIAAMIIWNYYGYMKRQKD